MKNLKSTRGHGPHFFCLCVTTATFFTIHVHMCIVKYQTLAVGKFTYLRLQISYCDYIFKCLKMSILSLLSGSILVMQQSAVELQAFSVFDQINLRHIGHLLSCWQWITSLDEYINKSPLLMCTTYSIHK